MKDYLEPSQATHIRVYTDYGYDDHQYVIDAADDTGGYSELIWELWDGKPMSMDCAIGSVAAFAAEFGRPDLADKIRIQNSRGRWVPYTKWHRLKATLCRLIPSRTGATT